MPLQRLSNSHYNDYSWVKIRVRTAEISENQDNAPIDAPQISKSHNFQSDHWIFKIHTFSKPGSQYLSRSIKIHSFWGPFEASGLPRATASKNAPRVINSPRHPTNRTQFFFSWNSLATQLLYTYFLSSKHLNTHQSFLILFSSPKTQAIILIPNLPFLGSTLRI